MEESDLKTRWARTIAASGGATDPGATYRAPQETVRAVAPDLPTVRASGSTAPETPAPANPARFDFIEEIGRGGMGVVFRALQRSLRREIAVKRILPGNADEASVGGFVSEALVTGALDHPNIVPVHELARTADGEVMLAMKLVGGRTWRSLIHPETEAERKAAAGYDLPRQIGVLLAVTNAVAFAHSRGIVHRDLKPANVMVGDYGEVLLMDWGLAADVTDDPSRARAPHKSTLNAPSGTPCYLAPELALGKGSDLGSWTDTYLLGGILHELVTGLPPHVGRSMTEVIEAAVASRPPVYGAEVPAELQGICRKALAKEPKDRFRTAEEFKSALEGYLKHRESVALSTAAEKLLSNCDDGATDRNRLYGRYAEAVAGFRQARLLWEENEPAKAGDLRARTAYARAALSAGDLGLAEAQAAEIDPADAGGARLRAEIAAAQAARARSVRASRLMKRGLVGAAAVIILGLATGVIVVRAEQKKTAAERDAAEKARTAEAEQRALAEKRETEARVSEWRSRLEAARGFYERSFALADAGRMQAAAACVLRALEIAPRDGRPAGFPVTADEPGWAEESWIRYRALDLQRPRQLHRFLGHPHGLAAAALSRDGSLAATGSDDGVVRVWDAIKGTETHRIPVEGSVVALSFSFNGQHLLYGTDRGAITLWSFEKANVLRRFNAARNIQVLDFSADLGTAIGCGSDGKTWTCDLDEERLDEKPGLVECGPWVRLFPDDNRALAGRIGEPLALVSLEGEGRILQSLPEETTDCRMFEFSSLGVLLATASPTGTITVWNTEDFRVLGRLEGHTHAVSALAFSRDRRLLFSASYDGTLRTWDLSTFRELGQVEGHADVVTCLATGDDPSRVFSGSADRTARLWALPWPGTLRSFDTGARGGMTLAFSPDGTAILAGSGDRRRNGPWNDTSRIAVFGAADGRKIATIEHPGEVEDFAFSPDGTLLATASTDGIVRTWNTRDWSAGAQLIGAGGALRSVAFAADGHTVVAGAYDGSVRSWAPGTTENPRLLSRDAGPAFLAPDAATVVFTEELTLFIRDGADPRRLGSLRSSPHDVLLSPDRRRLFTGSLNDLRAWDARSAREIRRIEFGTGSDRLGVSLASTPDGRVLLSGCWDGLVHAWDTVTWREIRTFRGHADAVSAVAVSPDGLTAASASEDGALLTWTLFPPVAPPPRPLPDDPDDPFREFAPFYDSTALRVNIAGRRRGEIEPVPVEGGRP